MGLQTDRIRIRMESEIQGHESDSCSNKSCIEKTVRWEWKVGVKQSVVENMYRQLSCKGVDAFDSRDPLTRVLVFLHSIPVFFYHFL